MSATFQFDIVSPDGVVRSDIAEMVIVPGTEGDFGVLAGHAPLVAEVRAGVVDVRRAEQRSLLFVARGFAEVTPSSCTVLAADAVAVEDIDRAAVEQEIRDLTEDLADAEDDIERRKAEGLLEIARAKLDAAVKYQKA